MVTLTLTRLLDEVEMNSRASGGVSPKFAMKHRMNWVPWLSSPVPTHIETTSVEEKIILYYTGIKLSLIHI